MADDVVFQTKIEGVEKLLSKLDAFTRDSVIRSGLTKGAGHLAMWVKENRLTGPRPAFLGVKTGRLKSSISFSQAEKTGDKYISTIGTNVEYARIHEFGGIIRPIRKKFLRFKTVDGSWHSVKQVTIPARPFLRPALEEPDNQREVINILTEEINEAVNKAK